METDTLSHVKQTVGICYMTELCDNLEGWDRVGGGREVLEGGDICTPMADSYWCMAETNIIL